VGNLGVSLITLTALRGCQDHTADVQLHAWGPSLEKALESVASCMFNYMTDLTTVEVRRNHRKGRR
jgi:SHS2 domain-containing protein